MRIILSNQLFPCKNSHPYPSHTLMPPLSETQFIESYDKYADDIFRHCYFRIGDRELGKELMQEAFMKTWEYITKGKKVKNLRAFLYRTANNLVIDYVRKQKKVIVSLEDMQEAGGDIAGEDDATADTKISFTEKEVRLLLHKIKEPYRTAVIMRYIDELQPKEISKALGISSNVTSVRINRGMEQLRSLLPQHA